MRSVSSAAFAALSLASAPAVQAEWSGRIGFEAMHFWNAPQNPAIQEHTYHSAFIEPKYNAEWDDGNQQFNFTGFWRWDPQDNRRQHGDIRELEWIKVGENYELRLGVRKVFWGATEAQHLVDIINQSDIVDDVSGDTKLGQPMLNLAFINSFGTIDLYVMPYFRERTFVGPDGRPRFRFVVDNDYAVYEARNGDRHVDFAARLASGDMGLDFGLSYFYGTSRAPRYVPMNTPSGPVIAPYYDLIHQLGLDATYATGAWLWKFEGIARYQQEKWFQSIDTGFEYTFSGVGETAIDVGLLTEYLWDSRGEAASELDLVPPIVIRDTPPYAFQNDVFIGTRIAFNDIQSSQILAGVSVDLDGRGYSYSVKAERRLGETWKLNLEWRGYNDTPRGDIVDAFRNEDFVKLTLAWYF